MRLVYEDERCGKVFVGSVPDHVVNTCALLVDRALNVHKSRSPEIVCTFGGTQSGELLEIAEWLPVRDGLHQMLAELFNESADTFRITHLHAIDYEPEGFQLPHTHKHTDRFSFVLYLDDSDACTEFWINENCRAVISKVGEIAVFDGRLLHWSTPTSARRRVLVGGCQNVCS